MSLLLAPATLAGLGYWFQARQDKEREKREETGKAKEAEAQREVALEAYLDGMSQLLLDKNLGFLIQQKSELEKNETALRDIGLEVIRARTLSILRRLNFQDSNENAAKDSDNIRGDGLRKGNVYFFLYDSGFACKATVNQGDGTEQEPLLDLRCADMRGASLSRGTLVGANLRGVDLTEADLTKADLTGADLREADLSRADLRLVNLKGADLSGANLTGAQLNGANLTGAVLYGADLAMANLRGALLVGAILTESNLSNAELINAEFSGASLIRANLSDANFTGANLYGTDLSGAILQGANLTGANLSDANFEGVLMATPKQLEVAQLCRTKLPKGFDLHCDRDD